MKQIAGCLFLFLVIGCGQPGKNAQPAYIPVTPTGKSVNPDAFNQPFDTLLSNYYRLKDDLTSEADTLVINRSAGLLMHSVDSLPLEQLPMDSTAINAISTHAQGISAELEGFMGEPEMREKRKEFQLISEQLYELVRLVRYDRSVIYHIFCVNAFPDQGAYWLNNTPVIKNPYNPKKMGDCGIIKDSVGFMRH